MHLIDNDPPFLLAIIGYGKPMFDIATCKPCEPCQGSDCQWCMGTGLDWTNMHGHKCHPYWYRDMNTLKADLSYPGDPDIRSAFYDLPRAPEDWPDLHQPSIDRQPRSSEPSQLLLSLGLAKPKVPIKRRSVS